MVELEQEIYKMSLEHFVVPESKNVLQRQLANNES